MYRSSLRFYYVFFGESLKIAKPLRESLPFLTKILRISSESKRLDKGKFERTKIQKLFLTLLTKPRKIRFFWILFDKTKRGIHSDGERSCRESAWKGDKRQDRKTRDHGVIVGEKTHHPELKVEKARTRPEKKIVFWKAFYICTRYVYPQITCFTLHHNP